MVIGTLGDSENRATLDEAGAVAFSSHPGQEEGMCVAGVVNSLLPAHIKS